jgi:predicted NUDIX family NTP pyrophosphohydrolase
MARTSAGLVMYRFRERRLEVFLAHPGGPFFARKDYGHWTIPKGEIGPAEDYLATAIREFKEEVCIQIDPRSHFLDLGSIRQKGGKVVHAWAVEQDWDDSRPFQSNTFTIEWPPGSGKFQEFPEVDRAQFFPIEEARKRIKATQTPLLDRLEALLKTQPSNKS